MGDDQLIKLTIHYGGSMKNEDDDYNYLQELGCKSVFWKLYEIEWLRFEEFSRSECVLAPISLIWFKEASEETKMMKYVFDRTNYDMGELRSSAKAGGEVDVYLEHIISSGADANLESCKWEVDGGYEPDEDEIRVEEGSEFDDGSV